MRLRSVCTLVALWSVLWTSGCCMSHRCCRRHLLERPRSCGCEAGGCACEASGYAPCASCGGPPLAPALPMPAPLMPDGSR